MANITHTKGDTFIRNLAFTTSAWVAVNLTGSTLKFSIKRNLSDVTYILEINWTLVTPVSWLAKFLATSAQMDFSVGNYYYDMQWIDSSWVVTTFAKGKFTLTYEITN